MDNAKSTQIGRIAPQPLILSLSEEINTLCDRIGTVSADV